MIGRKAKPNRDKGNVSPLKWWLRGAYPLLWFAISAFVLYGQSIGFGYTYLDDHKLILNQMARIGHPDYILNAFKEDVFHTPGGQGFYYRPILTVSFVVDAVLGKGNLTVFHISNIVFHLLATFMVFQCFRALQYEPLKSFIFSLVFLVHPVLTQAVAWIPGRNDILLALFILTSFYGFIRFSDTGKRLYLYLHFGAWMFALLTKETAMVLPALLFPAGFIFFRTPASRMTYLGIGWFILALVWFTIRASVLGGVFLYPVRDSIVSLVSNLPAVLPFLGKSMFPFSLSVFPILPDMWVSSVLGIIAIMVLAVLVVLTRRRRWDRILFAFGWYILFLIPTFIKHTQSPDLTEHRVYLPLIGIIMFFLETEPVQSLDIGKLLPKISAMMLLLLFTVMTFMHLQSFSDRYSFWQNAVKTSPSHAYNYNTLGAMYYLDGDLDRADQYFRKAVEINPAEPQANSNIGLIYMRKGDLDEAKNFYRKEIMTNPTYDNVYYNFGILYYRQGNIDSAVVAWEKTIEVNPSYTDAYKLLMLMYDTLKRPDDYQRILELAKKNGLISP